MSQAAETHWRQGDVLTHDAAVELGLVASTDQGKYAVVITHDCDLAQEAEKEPHVELIIATAVSKLDGNFTLTKNARVLHLEHGNADTGVLNFEFRHTERQIRSKDTFLSRDATHKRLALLQDEKHILKMWLAARYGRPAYPNSLESRLRGAEKKPGFEKRIATLLEPKAQQLVGVYFDLGNDQTTELTEDVPYMLNVVVMYDSGNGQSEARQVAEGIAQGIRTIFDTLFPDPDAPNVVLLDKCEAMADTKVTVAQMRSMSQWRVEHISLKDDVHGDVIQHGTIT